MSISSYKDLIVWQKSMELVSGIYCLTKKFPKEEIYGITSQMRRSAVSIPSNIAEGYLRGHRAEYVRFLQISFGSGGELETQLLISQKLQYAEKVEVDELINTLEEIMKMLNKLITSLKNPNLPNPLTPSP